MRQRGGLLFGAGREIAVALGYLFGRGRDSGGMAFDIGNQTGKVLLHLHQSVQQLSHFVAAADVQRRGEIACRDLTGEANGVLQRTRHRTADHQRHENRHQRDRQQTGQQHKLRMTTRIDLLLQHLRQAVAVLLAERAELVDGVGKGLDIFDRRDAGASADKNALGQLQRAERLALRLLRGGAKIRSQRRFDGVYLLQVAVKLIQRRFSRIYLK